MSYYFRYIVLFAVLLLAIFCLKKVIKGKEKISKIKSLICLFLCVTFIAISFFGSNLKVQPAINKDIAKPISKLLSMNTCKENETLMYLFDCENYYGYIYVNELTQRDKERVNSHTLKFTDGIYDCYASSIHCNFDLLMYPGEVDGGLVVFDDKYCVSITYFYKSESKIPVLKHFIFTEIVYKAEINLSDVINGIDKDSFAKITA